MSYSSKSSIIWVSCFVIFITVCTLGACTTTKQAPLLGRLTVLVSGNSDGYLKNCGCSAGQFGGTGRMARMMYEEQQIALKPQPTDHGLPSVVLLIDTGNMIEGRDEVKKIESAAIIKVMETLPYDSVGLGFNELLCSQEELWKMIGESTLPFTAANLKFTPPKLGQDLSQQLNGLFKPYRVKTLDNGYRIGIIHVLDQTYLRRINPDEGAVVGEADKAVQEVMDQHAQEADFWIVTVADGVQGSQRAQEVGTVPGLGMIIGFEEYIPSAELANKLPVYVDPPFRKSRNILRATVKYDAQGLYSSAKVDKLQLQESLKATTEAQAIIDATQPLLEAEANRIAEESTKFSGPHPWYVGITKCTMCHSDIALMLQETKHIHAYETLQEQDQHRSAACLPCHVIGYDAPDRGGFNIFEKEPETLGVKCESCHGPGEYHVAMMSGENTPPDATADGRDEFGLIPLTADASSCIKCHDELNSVGFSFEKYWPRMQHGNGLSPDLTDKSELGGATEHTAEGKADKTDK